MVYHNPFIVNGKIKFPENTNLVKHVEKWAKVRGDKLAYRFLDYSTERDGVECDISWSQFSARNRAVGARLQQVTQPDDRIAVLCPQNLDYLVALFGTLYAGRTAVPLFDPSEPGHVGRLHAVLDDCTPSTILTTTPPPRASASSSAPVRPRSGPASSPSTRCPTRSPPPGSSPRPTRTPSPTCSTPPAPPAPRPAWRSPT
jgi:acyl-CoA synthetase (AMP-forming)/AMP-acid ligase II